MKKLNSEEIQEVVKLYVDDKYSAIKIAKKYNVSPPSIYGILKRRNIERRSYSSASRKYTLDETFFDNVDTEGKAYCWGFLMADGYNNEKRNAIEISCAIKDKEILELINSLMGSNKPIRLVNNNDIKSYRIDLCSARLSKKLSKLGCPQTKTYKLKFPKMQKKLIKHFIRGYFDGDGCISHSFSSRNNSFGDSFNCVVTLTSTESFCLSLMEFFRKKLEINSSLLCRHENHNNNIRTLQVSGSLQVEKLMEWMYADSQYYLKRKKDKYEAIKAIVKQRRDLNTKNSKKGLLRISNITKNSVEYWNARYFITKNIVPHKTKSLLTSEQGEILRQKLDKYGEQSAIPQETIDTIFKKYREDGFPYYDFSLDQMTKKMRSLQTFNFDKKKLRWAGLGTELASYFHPHMFDCKKKKKMSPLEFFQSDDDFKRGIKKIVSLYSNITPAKIREICCNEKASSRINNFPPRVMIQILKKLFYKDSITMLDPCAGFSGRLIGAYASGIVNGYTGIDLSPQTFDGLVKTKQWLESLKEENMRINVINENYLNVGLNNSFDFIFTSPPFLDAEEYIDVPIESNYSTWVDNFIIPFIAKSYEHLNNNGKFAVYLEKIPKHNFLEDFTKIAENQKLLKLDPIIFNMSYGENNRNNKPSRQVPILVFEKP